MIKKEIHPKYLPTRIKFTPFIVIWLLLERFNATDFVYGFFYCLVALYIIGMTISLYTTKFVHPSELDKD
jgi:hypothetical protein